MQEWARCTEDAEGHLSAENDSPSDQTKDVDIQPRQERARDATLVLEIVLWRSERGSGAVESDVFVPFLRGPDVKVGAAKVAQLCEKPVLDIPLVLPRRCGATKNEDVLWLEIAMDDPAVVEHGQAGSYIQAELFLVCPGDGGVVGRLELGEIAKVGAFEHDGEGLCEAQCTPLHVDDVDHVVVVENRGVLEDSDLATEPLQSVPLLDSPVALVEGEGRLLDDDRAA